MEDFNKLIANYNRFVDEHPEYEIHEGIKDGYEFGFYDEETGMILTVCMEGDELKIKAVQDAYFIPKKEDK